MCHNGSEVVLKFEKHHISRLPHPPYSPDTSPCDFWLFGMLKGVLKHREFNLSDEIEEAITKVWDEMQRVFHNWMSRLTWVIENRENILFNQHEMVSWHVVNLKIGGEPGTVFIPCIMCPVSP
jgi:hypothetical protein